MKVLRGDGGRPMLSRMMRIGLVVAFFALPAAAALLSFLGVQDASTGAEGLTGASGVAASPDGRHVYATGASDDSVAVFRWDPSSQQLQFVESLQDEVGGVFGLDSASAVATSPDGRHVYVTGQFDDAVAVFTRSPSAGGLTFPMSDSLTFIEARVDGISGVFGLDGASDVTVSPDDRHVYVTGSVDNSLVIFSRDATRDDLTFVGWHENGFGGVLGLGNASAVATSPDGEYVYATGSFDDAVVVFSRDATRDDLTFVETKMDGVDGVNGLDGASDVAVSPDSQHIYVTGRKEDSVAVFQRGAGGALAPVQVVRQGVGGVQGIVAPSSVTVSRGGTYVFVAGRGSDSIATFRRAPLTGLLTFEEVVVDGIDGVEGLDGVAALTTSYDGRFLYATGNLADALALFRSALIFGDGFESGDTSRWSLQVP